MLAESVYDQNQLIFALFGLAVAAAYLFVGCIVHAFLRRKSLRPVLVVHAVLALMLVSVLTVSGITAHYEEAETEQAPAGEVLNATPEE